MNMNVEFKETNSTVDVDFQEDKFKTSFADHIASGGETVDLSNYYTKSEVDNLVSGGVVSLIDKTTGKNYTLYVENGKLKLEEKGG